MEDFFDLNLGTYKEKEIFKTEERVNWDNMNTDFRKEEPVYFNKDNMLTLGNGDGEMNNSEYIKNKKIICHNNLNDFLNIFEMLIFFCDPYLCNDIIITGIDNHNAIFLLADLFGSFNFHIYTDIPKESDKGNVKIIKDNFDDTQINFWKNYNKDVILIFFDLKEDTDKDITQAMLIKQKELIEEISPYCALIKFSPEMKANDFLDGLLLRGIYNHPESYITSLMIKGIGYRDWDMITYKRKINFHQQNVRLFSKYLNPLNNEDTPINEKKGLLNDYDSTAFCVLILEYLKKINQTISDKNMEIVLNMILERCNKEIIDLKILKLLS